MQVNQNANAVNIMQTGSQQNTAFKTAKPGEGKEEQDFASFLKPSVHKNKQELSDFNESEKNRIQKKSDVVTTEVEKTDIKKSNAGKTDNTSPNQTKDLRRAEKGGQQTDTEDSTISTDTVPDVEPVEVLVKEDESALTEEETEVLLETISQLLQTVMNQFGLAKEELAQKLEGFGMKVEDLFTPEGVKTFFLNMENADPCDLLVNEELNSQLNNFVNEMNQEMEIIDLPLQTIEEFIKSYDQNGILINDKDKTFVLDAEKVVPDNEETLNGVLDNNDNIILRTTVTNEPEVIVSDHRQMPDRDVQIENQDVQVSNQDVKVQNQYEQMPNRDEQVTNQDEQMPNQDGQTPNQDKHASGQIVNDDKQDGNMLKQSRQELSSNEDAAPKDNTLPEIRKPNTGSNKNFFENSILQSINEAFNKVNEMTSTEETQISGRQIIEQIVEQVKVEMNQNTSSLELQLYPEHLGKIQIQVVSKDGVMTARIAAETETARQAIENGLSNLKDAMEQQDLKVDAIEVMVSTTGFGKSDEEQNMEQQQKSSKSGRHINLSDIEDEDNLEDTAEMEKMRAVGSSVSYTA